MTFEELQNTLPNGFHDAQLRSFTMDYVSRTLCLELDVWIGDMADDPVKRETYRPARVTCESVGYLVIEPPDARYPWDDLGSICIDAGTGKPSQSQSVVPPTPDGTTVTWLYSSDLNRFFLFPAGICSMEWTGEAFVGAR